VDSDCYICPNCFVGQAGVLFVNFRFCLGSVSKARIEVKEHYEAKRLEEQAAERSSMPYRAPELFNIPSQAKVDEKTDVWVGTSLLISCTWFGIQNRRISKRKNTFCFSP
jgi:hypothetical protein